MELCVTSFVSISVCYSQCTVTRHWKWYSFGDKAIYCCCHCFGISSWWQLQLLIGCLLHYNQHRLWSQKGLNSNRVLQWLVACSWVNNLCSIPVRWSKQCSVFGEVSSVISRRKIPMIPAPLWASHETPRRKELLKHLSLNHAGGISCSSSSHFPFGCRSVIRIF